MNIKNFTLKFRLRFKKLIIDIQHVHLKDLRNFTFASIKKLPNVSHLKNLVLFSSLFAVVILALFVQRLTTLNTYFVVEKPAFGGTHAQGVIGPIVKINPLFEDGEAEKAANKMVYSGLVRTVDGVDYTPDLAKSWEITNEGKTYTFKLKENIKWHDGKQFNANDVVYTIATIQNPDTRTPLSQIWRGVKVNKVNDYEVSFELPNSFPAFLEVANQPIIPEHIYKDVDPKNLKVSEYNLKPVGTGPYKFVRFDQVGAQKEAVFEKNSNFAISNPFLGQIKLVSYANEKELFDGLGRRQIGGVLQISPQFYGEIDKLTGVNIYKKYIPEYEVMYLNLKNELLKDKNIRIAISKAIDRNQLVNEVLKGYGQEQVNPLLPGRPGYDPKVNTNTKDIAAANALLDQNGWIRGNDGIRTKEGKRLSFKYVFPDDYQNRKTAELVKKQLAEIGVNADLTASETDLLSSNYVRPRNFDILLIGQNVGLNQDWYSFWHSSQAVDPGLNLSGFNNRALDKLVEQVRKTDDITYRSERYKQASQIITDEVPVVFLYRPNLIYAIASNVKGSEQKLIAEPIDILNNIYSWYINTKKTF